MVVCEVQPNKDNPDRICRITIGGSRICYPGDVGTDTASLELFKLLLNSVLSCKGAGFSSIDVKIRSLDSASEGEGGPQERALLPACYDDSTTVRAREALALVSVNKDLAPRTIPERIFPRKPCTSTCKHPPV